MSGNSESLENLSTENRTFPPSAAFAWAAKALDGGKVLFSVERFSSDSELPLDRKSVV